MRVNDISTLTLARGSLRETHNIDFKGDPSQLRSCTDLIDLAAIPCGTKAGRDGLF